MSRAGIEPAMPSQAEHPGPRSRRRSQTRTRIGLFVLALVVAALAALGTGAISYRKLAAGDALSATVSAGPDQSVVLGGYSYRLDSFGVAASFPAEDSGDPVVRGPRGSVIILVVFTQTPVDPRVSPDDHSCIFMLRGPAATWEPDTDFTTLMRRPKLQTCSDLDDDPLRVGRARQVGVGFVVPAAAAPQVTFQASIDSGRRLLELHR